MGMILYTYKSPCGCGGGAYYSDSSQEKDDGGNDGDRECGKKIKINSGGGRNINSVLDRLDIIHFFPFLFLFSLSASFYCGC